MDIHAYNNATHILNKQKCLNDFITSLISIQNISPGEIVIKAGNLTAKLSDEKMITACLNLLIEHSKHESELQTQKFNDL